MGHCWTTDRSVRARLALFAATHRPSTMKQLQLPIITSTISDPAAFIGTTDWVLLSQEQPPVVGWWLTRRVSRRQTLVPRRWWNGKAFSCPVWVGDSDSMMEEMKQQLTRIPVHDLEWAGLKQPHPERYPYRLFTFGEHLYTL